MYFDDRENAATQTAVEETAAVKRTKDVMDRAARGSVGYRVGMAFPIFYRRWVGV